MTRTNVNSQSGSQTVRPDLALLDRSLDLFWGSWTTPTLLGIVVALLALNVHPHWIPTKDSALYLTLARSLLAGRGYQINGGIPHTTVLPGFPLVLAGISGLVGENFLVINMVMACFGLGCVLLTARLLRPWVGPRAAVCVAFLLGFNESFVHASSRVLTDGPHLFFALLVLTLLQEMCLRTSRRGRLIAAFLVGPAILVTLMIRVNGLLLIPIAAGLLFWPRRNRLTPLEKTLVLVSWLIVLGGPLVIWQWHTRSVDPALRMSYATYLLERSPANLFEHVTMNFSSFPMLLAESLLRNHMLLPLDIFLVLLMGMGMVRLITLGAGHLVAFTVMQLLLYSTVSYLRRYLVVVLPFSIVCVILGTCALIVLVTRPKRGRPGLASRLVVIFLCVAMVLANLFPVLKWTVAKHVRPFYEKYDDGRWNPPVVLGNWIRVNTPVEASFWTAPNPSVLMYLADRKVVGPETPWHRPDPAPVTRLEYLQSNLRYWKPDYLIRDDHEPEHAQWLDRVIASDRIVVEPVDVPGASGFKVFRVISYQGVSR